jgi:predicted transcriptional regulator
MAVTVKKKVRVAAAAGRGAVRDPGYKPTTAELAAIRRGEAAIARGEFVTLPQLLHELDRSRRRARAKTDRKVPS